MPENLVCALCQCGLVCYELDAVVFHIVKNPFEIVECGMSPVHPVCSDHISKAPRFYSETVL